MSWVEHNRGFLIPIDMTNGLENVAQQISIKHGWEMRPDVHKNFVDVIEEYGYRKYVVIDNIIYKVKNEVIDSDEDIFNATILQDGRIQYETKFYNGGCSFDEAIMEAIENIK